MSDTRNERRDGADKPDSAGNYRLHMRCFAAMSAMIEREFPSEHEVKSLGALLYAKRSRPPSLEKDWVELLRSIAAGDQVGLHTLYAQTHHLVFTLLVRICKSRDTAEELTVDVFHDVWRQASSYESQGGSVLGWIMNLARSRAMDQVPFDPPA